VRSGHKETSKWTFGSSLGVAGFLALLVDPGVSHVGNLRHKRQVVAAIAIALPPLITLLVQPAYDDAKPGAGLALVAPQRCFDATKAELMSGPVCLVILSLLRFWGFLATPVTISWH
jgi:hypothetical protein